MITSLLSGVSGTGDGQFNRPDGNFRWSEKLMYVTIEKIIVYKHLTQMDNLFQSGKPRRPVGNIN